MNDLKKKLLGVAGLLFVAVMTVLAAAIPSVGVYASDGNLPINVTVENNDPIPSVNINITAPSNGANTVDATGVLTGTYVNTGSITVAMTGPGGTPVTPIYSSVDPSGIINEPYAFNNGYGTYTFTISSENLEGTAQPDQIIAVSYHSAYFEVLPDTDADGNPTMKVTFGPDVCGVRFTIISADDPSKASTYFTALTEAPINCLAQDNGGDGSFEIAIPFSDLDFEPGNYKILMTTYGCMDDENGNSIPNPDDVIEENLLPTGGTDNNGNFPFTPNGELPEVPDTGMLSIAGMIIAEKDIVITGGVAFITVICVYFFLRTRRRIKV